MLLRHKCEQLVLCVTLIACTNTVQPIEIFNKCTQSLLYSRYLLFGFGIGLERKRHKERKRGAEKASKEWEVEITLKIHPKKANQLKLQFDIIYIYWSMYLIQFDQLFHWIIEFVCVYFTSFSGWFVCMSIVVFMIVRRMANKASNMHQNRKWDRNSEKWNRTKSKYI